MKVENFISKIYSKSSLWNLKGKNDVLDKGTDLMLAII